VFYVRNPTILIHTSESDGARHVLIERHPTTPPLIVEDHRLLWALLVLPERFSQAEAIALWSAEPACVEIAEALWSFCAQQLFIVPADDAVQARPVYHDVTRSYPFLYMARESSFRDDNRLMASYLETEGYPPLYLSLPGAAIALRKAEDVLDASETDDVSTLSLVLDGTFGERERIQGGWDESGRLQLELMHKAVPSGGARHPTECFAYLEGFSVPQGLYHYDVGRNALVLQDSRVDGEWIRRAVPAFGRFASSSRARAVLFLASHVHRAMWRYRDPRSFRAVAMDVGHIEEMLALVCAEQRLRCHRFAAIDDRGLEAYGGLGSAALPVFSAVGIASC
jgi:SagB-type dehydrogenase family enzyme